MHFVHPRCSARKVLRVGNSVHVQPVLKAGMLIHVNDTYVCGTPNGLLRCSDSKPSGLQATTRLSVMGVRLEGTLHAQARRDTQ